MNGVESMDFVIGGPVKKREYQQFFVDIARNFLTYNFFKNETATQVFFCEFCKVFRNTYFAEHLRRAASNDLINARFFCKIYYSLKQKIKGYQR